MTVKKLYALLEDFFGYKANMRYLAPIAPNVGKVACILYDSFWLECRLDDQHNRFNAGIILENEEGILTNFLGKQCLPNSDEESIKQSLQIVDDYCRLRLPDKFLEAYYYAYVLSQYEDCDL